MDWFFLDGKVGTGCQSWPLNNPGRGSLQEGGRAGLDAGCGQAAADSEEAGDKVRMWAKREKSRTGDEGPRDGPTEPCPAKGRSFKGAAKAGLPLSDPSGPVLHLQLVLASRWETWPLGRLCWAPTLAPGGWFVRSENGRGGRSGLQLWPAFRPPGGCALPASPFLFFSQHKGP